ncbi:hypothetical protein ATK17_3931 [Branchiibius hedensis]|uniref:Colicin import membrane protein n=1 Tax=Branchiibius hedensis TaxID=672460 RepID=A0A2Y9CAX8_9MICO|nr:hypothetical protein [Branchiibius hedensis]PWJ22990.1 hypothetical protein ATK17_3879 [Branchiibius hedensis]PWJ23040.1 hypothetical protein ATK17_3931 [Branchiibius hedensis]SSA59066.1 hypothetical protein SAMN04489750_3879 [Branchiibius hedensis]SSA59116.1 hypothetical protein SAMN04489750_3931 [Branchiibius hedensis]
MSEIHDQPDGIADEFDSTIRTGVAAAAQAAEQWARRRHAKINDRQSAAAGDDSAPSGPRLDAQQSAAQASLEPLRRTDWWDNATPDQVVEAYRTTTAWPDQQWATDNAALIAGEVKERWNVEITPDDTPESLKDKLDDATNTKAADTEQGRADADVVEAERLMARANGLDDLADSAHTEHRDAENDPDMDTPGTSEASTGPVDDLSTDQADPAAGPALYRSEDGDIPVILTGNSVADDQQRYYETEHGQLVPDKDLEIDLSPETLGYRAEWHSENGRVDEAAFRKAAATAAGAADRSYDSADRREKFADSMRAEGVPEKNVQTRLRADVSYGAPATAATSPEKSSPSATTTATKAKRKQLGRRR